MAQPMAQQLLVIPPTVLGPFKELTEAFEPHTIWLVGGSVRDIMLGQQVNDLDFATDAPVESSEHVLRKWGDAYWEVGKAFGTVCASKNGVQVEVTTLRSETYTPGSRKPEVLFTGSHWDDLYRRDFTVNAMSIKLLPDGTPVFSGVNGCLSDLEHKILRTPLDPKRTFADDPLRMVRAARFSAQLGFETAIDLQNAASQQSPLIRNVATERVLAELDKLLTCEKPYLGLQFMYFTGLAHQIGLDAYPLPLIDELPNVLELRWAAWLFRNTPEEARRTLKHLHHSARIFNTVPKILAGAQELIEHEHVWPLNHIRRFMWKYGELANLCLILVELYMGKEFMLGYTDVWWNEIAQNGEDWTTLKQPLSGQEVMSLLGTGPGPEVGEAMQVLQEYRLNYGPMTKDLAIRVLRSWRKG